MASRRRAREYALQALFQMDLTGISGDDALASLWAGLLDPDGVGEGRPAEDDEVSFASRIVVGVGKDRERLDTLIESCSTNWRLTRMPVVDRNILRMACYELTAFDEIPGSVTINEAIELAKRFGGAESRAFVNGIVDRVARQVGRVPEARRG